ncbi:protein mono-ADP-ribosyltransferase PARP12 [Kryptolebias marmoratus]|uniref:Poly (ADP-ribose) polymerase family, member 12a n=1 Tax=Kryptolebias marmoratus TaxID=37003 RepID=A0A3Q3BSC3_KRYMA|nr:protein mono-ADP-ribosyltransferase PARP12 [Kryptolebias marmoratus]
MESKVSKLITKILCDNHGCLDFEQLNDLAQSNFGFEAEDLRSVLFDDGKIAIREGKQQVAGGDGTRPDSLVVAKTSLRLCQKKAGECTLDCHCLHLCRYFVCGSCTFGEKCKNPHSLTFPHNGKILRRNGLQDLTEKQLFQLLLQNDPFLLPEICPHYNKGDGPFGSCRFTTSCTKLHACQHFLQGDCRFGDSCKRTHHIDAHGMKLFQRFSPENFQNIYKIYRNKFIIMGQRDRQFVPPVPLKVKVDVQKPSPLPVHTSPTSPTKTKPISDAERKEICLYNIRTHCSFKEKCARVHWHLPYKWEVLDTGTTWKDIPDMEDIEKAFCDPSCDTSCMDQQSPVLSIFNNLRSALNLRQYVNFKTMTYGGSPVRRLSTASSVLHPPHFILTTQWVWYWKEDNGSWLEYGQGEGITVTSQTLEKLYLEDNVTQTPFQAGKHQYILHFKDAAGAQQMYQQNIQYKTKREVRRRPRFVSVQDVERLKSAPSQSSSSSPTAESVPPHWDKKALPDLGYKLVPLSSSHKEFDMIQTLFRRTMPHSKITSIQRIQNPSLWKVFYWQKEQMQKRNGGKPVDERYLFHGTDDTLVDAICDQNFDWRMCGVHGTAYGKGSYFARDASYSDRYSRVRGTPNKVMFVALVLVGESTKGRNNYVRPPLKEGSTFYDSCIDSMSSPSIFVVFEKQQIYPEYLIKYV